jgi:hypothetical protein
MIMACCLCHALKKDVPKTHISVTQQVEFKIKLNLGCKLLSFDILQYGRLTNMFLRNILLPSAGTEGCVSDHFVNSCMFCGLMGKKMTTHISSWNEVWYSSIGKVNIKHKIAGICASRYGKNAQEALETRKITLQKPVCYSGTSSP